MKRDAGLIRELLRAIEAKEHPRRMTADDFTIDGSDRNEISYHLRLLYEAGYVSGEPVRSTSNPERLIDFWVFDLTWQGHEFLAASRDERVWRKVMNGVGTNLSAVPFSVLTAVLIAEAKKQVGLP